MEAMLPRLRTTILATVAALTFAPSAAAWSWPASGPVLRPFSLGPDPYAGGQHRGVDVGGKEGEQVLAPRAGVVAFAGSTPGNGLTVTIRTDEGYSVTLVHLGSIAVKRDGSVAEGDPLGTIGPSGDAELPEPYVHLGVRLTTDPNGYLDPLRFLPPRSAPAAPPPAPAAATEPRAETATAPPTGRTTTTPPAAPAAQPAAASPPAATAVVTVPAPEPVAVPPPSLPSPAPSPASPVAEPAAVAVDEPPSAGGESAALTVAASKVARPQTPPPVPVARPRPASTPADPEPTVEAPPAPLPAPAHAPARDQSPSPVHPQRSAPTLPAWEARRPPDATPRPLPGIAQPGRHTLPLRTPTAAPAHRRSLVPVPLVAFIACALGCACLLRRRPPAAAAEVARQGAPIISPDAFLPDNTDLLRELDPAHRARVHDDRRRHPRPASPSARRGDVLLDGRGRARGQGCAGGGRAGAHAPRVHGRHRRGLAGVAAQAERHERLLHPHER